MFVTAFAASAETGLAPTIRIRDLSDASLVVTDAALAETGDGGYRYDFAAAVVSKQYQYRIDWGAAFGQDRYDWGDFTAYAMETTAQSVKAKTDALPSDPADQSLIEAAISAIPSAPSAVDNADAVRSELATELARIDVATSTRLASASYVAPDNAGIAAIPTDTPSLAEIEASTVLAKENTVAAVKSKTDNLPSDPADQSAVEAAISAIPAAPSAATVADAVRTELSTELSRMDVAISSRNSVAPLDSSATQAAAASALTAYDAATAADVAAIPPAPSAEDNATAVWAKTL